MDLFAGNLSFENVLMILLSLCAFYIMISYLQSWIVTKSYIAKAKKGILSQREKIQAFLRKYPESSQSNVDLILAASVKEIVKNVSSGIWTAEAVTLTYCWKAIKVNEEINCLTEILFEDAIQRAKSLDALPAEQKTGLLFGVPVSIKDCIDIAGYPSSAGVIKWSDEKASKNSIVVEQLLLAGAIPFCKTNVPQSMLSFECRNPLWGKTENPFKRGYSPGGSSGGEAALVAAGGSVLGVGNDIAGSVRIPAHFCGLFSLKPSCHRISNRGIRSLRPSTPLIYPTIGPLARSLEDMVPFLQSCAAHGGSHDVIPVKSWSEEVAAAVSTSKKTLRFGVLRSISYMKVTPACSRAVEEAVAALERSGYEVVPFELPVPSEDLACVLFEALASDGGRFINQALKDEPVDPVLQPFLFLVSLPAWLLSFLSFLASFHPDQRHRLFLSSFGPKSSYQIDKRAGEQKQLINVVVNAMAERGLDALVAPAFATPALPHESFVKTTNASAYAFIWNALNFVAGVVPVTKVDKSLDALPRDEQGKTIKEPLTRSLETDIHAFYDVEKMHRLPLGVQVVTPQFCEVQCLAAMKALSDALGKK